MKNLDHISVGRRTIHMEANAVADLESRIGNPFSQACELILNCKGRVIVTGMGKSGHIANKIAATLASTGTPSFFVHPGEASHGDLGMITESDTVLAISNSGTTSEIVTLLPLIKRMSVPLISMTGNPESLLAKAAHVNLDISIEQEACPLGLAPTTSTTVTLVMGDALAVALLEARGFTAEDFAFSHPGGALGRRLLLRVEDIMHAGQEVPTVSPDTPLKAALLEMTQKGFGMTTVVDSQNHLTGVFTDGDLRRALDQGIDINSVTIADVYTPGGKSISAELLAAEALKIMEDSRITALVVEDQLHHPVGVLHMHDIIRAGVI
ncbi:MAG: KpsF/GutQ family sugar-phosphate isomerase [bacterium]